MDRDKVRIFANTLAIRILSFVAGGYVFFYSYGRRKEVIMDLFDDIINAREEVIKEEIKRLYKNRYIYFDRSKGKYILTARGKKILKKLELKKNVYNIKRKKYEKKWFLVFFDIPEEKKKIRDSFSNHLKSIGFYEIQKSVFVFPAVVKEEMEFIIEYYDIKKYVRYAVCDEIDNQFHLKKIFNII